MKKQKKSKKSTLRQNRSKGNKRKVSKIDFDISSSKSSTSKSSASNLFASNLTNPDSSSSVISGSVKHAHNLFYRLTKIPVFEKIHIWYQKKALLKENKSEKKKIEKTTIQDVLKKQRSKDHTKKSRKTISEQRRQFKRYLDMAGFDLDPKIVEKWLIAIVILIDVILLAFYLSYLIKNAMFTFVFFLIVLLVMSTLGSIIVYLIVRSVFLFYLDLQKYKRNANLERVLPDYLQLTSANIRAGMPIDQALWLAVRPRFGVLAKQIEIVAKETLVGDDLIHALKRFANKFESPMLKRSINILIEGMAAGGDVGEILNKISLNLQDASIMKKEMAASVMTYVIFISVASIGVAPFMFGLSYQLLQIVQGIMTQLNMGGAGHATSSIISIGGDATVSLSNFKIFAVTCLSMTAFFSSIIITTIRKGDYREGLSYIPVFIGIAIFVFFMSIKILGMMFGGMMI